MEKDGTDFDENLDLGEENVIIRRKDNLEQVFKNIFIKSGGFVNEHDLDLSFHYLSKIRNPNLHGKSFIPSKEDFDQCNIYLQKFYRTIPEIVSEQEESDE